MDDGSGIPGFVLDRLGSGVAGERDRRFGELAVSAGFVRPEQVDECLRNPDPGVPLSRMLIDRGWITPGQTQELQRRQAQMAGLPPEAAPFLNDPARQIGHHLLVAEIGQGGMGVVWRAWDRRLGRWVAVKTLRREGSDRVLTRFVREGQAMARLRHPHIVSVHEAGEWRGRPYVVMELVRGEPLDLKGPLRRTVELLAKAAEGLEEAHRQGVIHRDLKPGNILVDESGEPRVVDFGLAHLDDSEERLTHSGAAVGTPLYMSPEQAAGQADSISARSDVYSLGVILYEAMAGLPPFGGPTVAAIYERILNHDPPRPPGPPDLAAICLKAIDRSPSRRYASAGALAQDLRAFLEGRPIAARGGGWSYPLRKWIARHRTAVSASAAIVLIAAAIWAWRIRERDHEFAAAWDQARAACLAGNWTAALAACTRAAEIRHDPEVMKLAAECERRLAVQRTEIRLDPTLRDHEALLHQVSRAFYIKTADIGAELAAVERSLGVLEGLLEDPGNTGSARAWTAVGKGRYLVGDLDRAEQALVQADRLGSGEAAHLLGRVYLEKSLDVAVGKLRINDPEIPRLAELAHRYLARPVESAVLHQEIDLEIARAYRLAVERSRELGPAIERAVRKFGEQPRTEEFWNLLALFGEPERKQERLTKAIDIRPHYPWAFYLRGADLWARGSFGPAEQDFSAVLRIHPRNARAWFARGSCRGSLGRAGEAIADYTEAIRLRPDHAEAFLNRGILLRDSGDPDRAIADFDRAVTLAPALADAYAQRGSAWYGKGDLDRALADFTRAIEADAGHPHAYHNRGQVRMDRKEYAEAEADYSRAIGLDARDYASLFGRGFARFELGRVPEAVADLESSLKHAPPDWRARPDIERMLSGLKKK